MPEPTKHIPGGLVVMFEGMDGTGKTTQLHLAEQALSAAGWSVASARAHGGTPIGEALREVSLAKTSRPPLTDMYLSLAIHAALVDTVQSWRDMGKIILIDRGPLSIVAYQIYGDGLNPQLVWPAVEADMAHFNPELCLVYTASVATARARAQQKASGGSDFFESKDEAYFTRVQAGYDNVAKSFDCRVIDSERASIEAVAEATQQAIYQSLADQLL